MAILILKLLAVRNSGNEEEDLAGKLASYSNPDREILIDEQVFLKLIKEGRIGLDTNPQTR